VLINDYGIKLNYYQINFITYHIIFISYYIITLLLEVNKPRTNYQRYKEIRLQNGLDILLVSDKEATNYSVSMTVGSGTNDDYKSFNSDRISGIGLLAEKFIKRVILIYNQYIINFYL